MGRVWSNSTSSIKDFERWLGKGKTVYVINNHAMITGQFEPHTYSPVKCTGRHPILGHWEMGANISAKSLVQQHKQVFENPPPGFRDLASAEPDCRDEGLGALGRGQEFKGSISDGIDEMDRLGSEARDRYAADRKAGRRKWGLR